MSGHSKCWRSGVVDDNNNNDKSNDNNGSEVPRLKDDHVHIGDKRGGLGTQVKVLLEAVPRT